MIRSDVLDGAAAAASGLSAQRMGADDLPSALRPASSSARDLEQLLRGRSVGFDSPLRRDGDRLVSSLAALSPGLADANIAKLSQDTVLHKLLADEKMRSEQHRTNYQLLKAEHSKLQSEMIQMQQDLSKLLSEKSDAATEHSKELAKLKRESAVAQSAIAELRAQVLPPEKLDALRTQLQLDTERPFRERLEKLDAENEALRAETGKLKYDLAFIKSEYEALKREDGEALDEARQQRDAEVANLRRERDDLVSRLQHEAAGDLQKARSLQRDNAQLNQKVKGLLAELDEMREQRELLGVESDHVTRLQQKQLVEFQANLKAVETEKDSLRKQCDNLMKELAACTEMQAELTRQLHDAEEKSGSLKIQLETAAHRSRIELTEHKMDAVKQKGELEREKDRLLGQLEDHKSKIATLEEANKRLEALLVDKEQDCAQRVNGVREEEFKRLSRTESEKLELESRVQQLERLKRDADERHRADTEQTDLRLKEAYAVRDTAEKEVASLKLKLQQQAAQAAELEQERSHSADARARLIRAEAERDALLASDRELADKVASLRQRLAAQADEARAAREAAAKQQAAAERAVAQQRSSWQDERAETRARLDELEAQAASARQQHADGVAEAARKKKQCMKVITKLKRKYEVAHAQLQELQIRLESLKSFAPPEALAKLKKELHELKARHADLRERHRDYRNIMLSGGVNHAPIGDKSFASASVNNAIFDTSYDAVGRSELQDLQGRMERVGANQERQMAELVGRRLPPSASALDDDDDGGSKS